MKHNSFEPPWWLRNPHLQTMWPPIFRRKKSLALTKERVELPDGDFVDLSWLGQGDSPIVMILHGFEGSAKSQYVNGMLQAINQAGWRAVVMHFRGCSGVPNRLPLREYHSGETSDIAFVVKKLRDREPNTNISAIGFSLGGNVLLKWLGETGDSNPLTAAIAISVPFELQKTSVRIGQGFSRLYQWFLLKSACYRLAKKYKKQGGPIDIPSLMKIRTLREFDNKVTAPLYDFLCAEDYYNKASSRQYLPRIRIPTLIIHSKDDPFMTEDIIPEDHELSEQVILEVSEYGGHCGFVTGKYPWRPEYWLEPRITTFLQECLSINAS